ncbi:MAG: helix-turn-helix domain-containing protein [Candidatus Thermoplasmatota archaeon]|jgi:predicted transcriptional regulator|nr:helix-turn-helix domain-containing protein [Candidatus Thermoplasmatota archaeon]MCL5790357.1 helix-turn-helix domain-containing protein [Candidatus Thermoplasmatota archaeon]
MTDIDDILGVLENSTRRAILRRLLLESSYALEISKSLGVSQQAINKQLDVLQKANLIFLAEQNQNSFGPPRKIYMPTGFSSIVIDYAPSFIDIKKYDLPLPSNTEIGEKGTINSLFEVEKKLDDLMRARKELLEKKNSIINSLKREIITRTRDSIIRDILMDYIEGLDPEKVAADHGLDSETVLNIIERFFNL